MSTSELKRLAKDQINGNILMLFVISLLIGLIGSIGGSIVGTITFGLGTIFVPALLAPFTIATIRIYQDMASTGKSPAIGEIFSGFDVFGKAFLATLLQTIYLALWSILFIPLFIKPYSYCLTSYIIADDPTVGANEAITLSRQMMDGHKLERFWLDLTFIGWDFLVVITFGLASIYVTPYKTATYLNFYNECKASYNAANYQ